MMEKYKLALLTLLFFTVESLEWDKTDGGEDGLRVCLRE